jgi:HSP20 family protein
MFGLQLVNEMENMQHQMDQIFRGFNSSPIYDSQTKNIDFKVLDNGDNYSVAAPLPGLDVEKLDISILGRRLTVSGEFTQQVLPEEVCWHRRERSTEAFEQNLQLPTNLDAEKIEAGYTDGILKINLPKALSALPKKIAVTVG